MIETLFCSTVGTVVESDKPILGEENANGKRKLHRKQDIADLTVLKIRATIAGFLTLSGPSAKLFTP